MTTAREALQEAIDVFEGMNDDEINVELLPRLREALRQAAAPQGREALEQKAIEMRNAIDMIEGALMGFGDLVDLPDLFEGQRDNLEMRVPATAGEMRRVCTALAECTRIINSDEFNPDALALTPAVAPDGTGEAVLPTPFAWVLPGDDTAKGDGWIDARINEWGEFTKPLYTAPPNCACLQSGRLATAALAQAREPGKPSARVQEFVRKLTGETAQVDSGRGPTAEDIYACAETTLIGFRDELTEDQIRFICDQISRKATMRDALRPERSGGAR